MSPYQQRIVHSVRLGIEASLSAFLAVYVCEKLGLDHPIYAAIAAVVVISTTPQMTYRDGLQRLLGTFLGAICGAIGGFYFPGNLFAMAASILIMNIICSLLNFDRAAKFAAYIPAVILLSASTTPVEYAWARFAETAIGLVFGILISLLFDSKSKNPAT